MEFDTFLETKPSLVRSFQFNLPIKIALSLNNHLEIKIVSVQNKKKDNTLKVLFEVVIY